MTANMDTALETRMEVLMDKVRANEWESLLTARNNEFHSNCLLRKVTS